MERTLGPYVGCKCPRLVRGQCARSGYMAVFVLVPRINFLHSTYPVEAKNLFSDAKYQRDQSSSNRKEGKKEEEEEEEE